MKKINSEPDQMLKDFAEILEMLALDISAGWDPGTIGKERYKDFAEKYLYLIPKWLHEQIKEA